MANEMPRNDILQNGMFFEMYIFDPQTNFTEEDLYEILRHVDITFNKEVEGPCPQHQDG